MNTDEQFPALAVTAVTSCAVSSTTTTNPIEAAILNAEAVSDTPGNVDDDFNSGTREEALAAPEGSGADVADESDAAAKHANESERREVRRAPLDTLLDITMQLELFHSSDNAPYADVMLNGNRTTMDIRKQPFRDWLMNEYFVTTGTAPSSDAMQRAIDSVSSRAKFSGPMRKLHVRVGSMNDKLYIDLGDSSWRAVEIDTLGWRVTSCPPVRFQRTATTRAIPAPVPGGSVKLLRSFLNVRSDDDFTLAVSWLLAALRDQGPYPLLVLSGEQGSAKSTFTAILTSIIDPRIPKLSAPPGNCRDLFIAASNRHLLAFDNMSGLPPDISDTLCRLSTGGGFSTRQLFKDRDEEVFEACRPVLLNGIADVATRPDLADRAIFLTLDPIPETLRRPESELWEQFHTAVPLILGALLDAVAEGLRRLPSIRLKSHPRMADFARWATACETHLWPSGQFLTAYEGNRRDAVESVLDADPVATAVRNLMSECQEWSGTASELLTELGRYVDPRTVYSAAWPKGHNSLSGRLLRAKPGLRTSGIEISHVRTGRSGRRTVRVVRLLLGANPTAACEAGGVPSAALTPSASSASSASSVPMAFAVAPPGEPVGNLDADACSDLFGDGDHSMPQCPQADSGAVSADDADDADDADGRPRELWLTGEPP